MGVVNSVHAGTTEGRRYAGECFWNGNGNGNSVHAGTTEGRRYAGNFFGNSNS
jgi:hypothetical protein